MQPGSRGWGCHSFPYTSHQTALNTNSRCIGEELVSRPLMADAYFMFSSRALNKHGQCISNSIQNQIDKISQVPTVVHQSQPSIMAVYPIFIASDNKTKFTRNSEQWGFCRFFPVRMFYFGSFPQRMSHVVKTIWDKLGFVTRLIDLK